MSVINGYVNRAGVESKSPIGDIGSERVKATVSMVIGLHRIHFLVPYLFYFASGSDVVLMEKTI